MWARREVEDSSRSPVGLALRMARLQPRLVYATLDARRRSAMRCPTRPSMRVCVTPRAGTVLAHSELGLRVRDTRT